MLALLAIVLPMLFTEANIEVDDLGAVQMPDSVRIEQLLSPEMIRADLGCEAIDGGYCRPDRLFSLPEGGWLLSWHVTSPQREPDSWFISTYDNSGALIDGIYAGLCDSRQFSANDDISVIYNHIPPAFDILPDGHATVTAFHRATYIFDNEAYPAIDVRITIGVAADGTLRVEEMRPVPDEIDRLADTCSTFEASPARDSLRSELRHYLPYSQPITSADIRSAASYEHILSYLFLRTPLTVCAIAMANPAILRALALCDPALLQPGLDALQADEAIALMNAIIALPL